MNKETNAAFVSKTESLVKPQDVTAISFLGDFNRMLPKKTQEKIMKKGSDKIPYMGFIVDPYCTFMAYRIENPAAAQAMLPEGYDLVATSVFKDQEPCPLVIISAFSARTSAFIGNRLEIYIIARRRESGQISWIIADYLTNTNSYDPKNRFGGYDADTAVLTTTPYGEVLADFSSKKRQREFSLSVEIQKGQWRELNQSLWVEGNMSIDYGGEVKLESSKPFSLIFDPFLMSKALHMPEGSIVLGKNNFLNGVINAQAPVCSAVFPYSQHFIIKQDLEDYALKTEADLTQRIREFLSSVGFKTMSGEAIKKPLLVGMMFSALLNYGIIALLLIALLLK